MNTLNIIPYPLKSDRQEGFFHLLPDTVITVETTTRGLGEYLAQQLRPATGFPFDIQDAAQGKQPTNCILLVSESFPQTSEDGSYSLSVDSDNILIKAPTGIGVFYGIQTLLQLLPGEIGRQEPLPEKNWEIPQLTIEDNPRFSWRGMHLDVGRHFMPKAFIKTYIDLMARYKMNIFHWHLTDDQGWRIESRQHPKLTEISAWRTENGKSYGGYYSQDDVREIVEYAQERYITVVPEIEMPGHSLAVLAAYPELSCTGGPFEVPTTWGVFDDVFCAGNENAFTFLEHVLTEVFDLFPGPYIHIGGDECPKTRWKNCPKCQERIRQEGLKDEKELQSFFIQRIGRFLAEHDKHLVGWDEILEGGLAPDATVMSWRGVQGGITAAKLGHPVVMTPESHCYFDHYQSSDFLNEPKAFEGHVLPLETVYAFEPVPAELPPEMARYVLGAQGNVWTEYIPDSKQAEYMILPRMCALAEVVWSATHHRELKPFLARLADHYAYFDAVGLRYRHHEQR